MPKLDPTPADSMIAISKLGTTMLTSKLSNLCGLEIDWVLPQLQELHSSIVVEEVPESDPMPDDTPTDELDSTIATLKS